MIVPVAEPGADDGTNLCADIAAFIASGDDDDEDEARFTRLARRVFARQFARNGPYRAFCTARGLFPESISDWREIPAAPALAFKHFALTCAPENACVPERGGRVFHSSGTTGAETSRHFLDAGALDLYRASLTAGYRRFVLPDRPGTGMPILALLPPLSAAPHSSLSFMLDHLCGLFGGRFFYEAGWQAELAAALFEVTEPVTLFGTAFAWVHFFDAPGEASFTLPVGSRIVETGGFKGRSREVSREELYRLFATRLGVPPALCIAEYGMSEMASQFYDATLYDHFAGRENRPPRKIAPPWLKTRVLDPVTGRESAPGEPGLLAHYDLASINSVLAIQTEDLGHAAAPDGDGFVLRGRAPGAILRGCSLTAEEMNALPAVTPG